MKKQINTPLMSVVIAFMCGELSNNTKILHSEFYENLFESFQMIDLKCLEEIPDSKNDRYLKLKTFNYN